MVLRSAHLLFVRPALVAISFWVCGLSSRGTCPPRWRPFMSRWAIGEAHHQTSGTSVKTSRATAEMCSEHNTKSSQSAPAILQAQSTTLACDSPPLFLSLSSCKPTSAHGELPKDLKTSDRGTSLPEDPVPSRLQPQGLVHGPQAMVHKPYPDDWKARRARADQGILDKCRLSLSLRQAGMAAPCIAFG
ncbi:hypothetical protein BDP67DRAFT_563099 [Colletotrichum lupini]|nr:hypothetical protein BDP67DRAFT_563099 [Colletotrichum lupini]